MPKEETILTVIPMEREGYAGCFGPLAEWVVVEVPESMAAMVESEDPDDWDWSQAKIIERCGHRHNLGSDASNRCERKLLR